MTADGGAELDVFAKIGIQLGRVADMMTQREERRAKLFDQLHQVPVTAPGIPLSAGAGALQMADTLSPKAGYMWSLRRLSCVGYTAGTVNVYKNGAVVGGVAIGGELVAPFPTAGVFTFGRGEMLMDQNDQLIISASGITLASGYAGIQIGGAADNFERWLLPEYLG